MTIFYFTGTGNSLAVAKHIGGKLVSIPQVMSSDDKQYTDDVIGLVFPVYWSTAPDIVQKFVKKVKLNADYLFMIATHGGMPGAAIHRVQKIAEENGYQFDYLADIAMIDNTGNIDSQLANSNTHMFEEKMAQIQKDITETKHNSDKKPKVSSRVFTAVVSKMPNYEKWPEKFKVDEKCNLCGTCGKVCPVGNIKIEDKVKYGNSCVGCLACYHNCPKSAIKFKGARGTARWRNPDVTLKEIIIANEQNNRRTKL